MGDGTEGIQGAPTLINDSDHDGDRLAMLDAADLDLAAAVGAVVGVAIGLPDCRRVSQSLEDVQVLLTDEVGDGDDEFTGVVDLTASTEGRVVVGQVARHLRVHVLASVCNRLARVTKESGDNSVEVSAERRCVSIAGRRTCRWWAGPRRDRR
jgi:hypothetical protein